jgi:S-(hydroxymethyl)glutathione dehydrogenase/alcohol dehydrogenase
VKAAILKELNKPLEICDVKTTDLKTGQVLVKVIVSGLCGAQLQEIKGFKGNEKFLPHLLGHEGCGFVQETGPGVSNVQVGDKVVMHWRVGRGIESDFPEYILDGKRISSGKVISLAEMAIVSENRLTKVPNSICPYFAALLGCGMTTALGVVNNEIDLKYGESLAVIGCGGVGLNLVQAGKLGGAYPIIGIDINEKKRDLAVSAGVNYYIDVSKDKLSEAISSILGKTGVDIVIDTSGHPPVIEEIVQVLSDTGRLVLVGQPAPGNPIVIHNAMKLFGGNGKMIKATQGGKTNPTNDIPRYAKLHEAGMLNIEKIVTHKFNLDDINTAFDVLRSGAAGRIMIEM